MTYPSICASFDEGTLGATVTGAAAGFYEAAATAVYAAGYAGMGAASDDGSSYLTMYDWATPDTSAAGVTVFEFLFKIASGGSSASLINLLQTYTAPSGSLGSSGNMGPNLQLYTDGSLPSGHNIRLTWAGPSNTTASQIDSFTVPYDTWLHGKVTFRDATPNFDLVVTSADDVTTYYSRLAEASRTGYVWTNARLFYPWNGSTVIYDQVGVNCAGFGAPPVVVGTQQLVNAFTTGGDPPAVIEPLELDIVDPTQYRAPTSVEVIVTGADPGATVAFVLDDFVSTIWTAVADSNGSLFLVSVPIPAEVDATSIDSGTHTLIANASGKMATDTFTLERDPSPWPQVSSADVDPVEIPGRGNSWAIQDPKPGGLGSWVMHPSPTSQTEPELSKVVDVDHSTHPIDGQYHLSVADLGVQPWQWSGYCPDQTFYEQLVAYANLNRRLWVLDHRGRAWKVNILRADLRARKRQIQDDGSPQDWAHDYTVTAEVLDVRSWEPVTP